MPDEQRRLLFTIAVVLKLPLCLSRLLLTLRGCSLQLCRSSRLEAACTLQAKECHMLEEGLCAFALNAWSCLQMIVTMLEGKELHLFSNFFYFFFKCSGSI